MRIKVELTRKVLWFVQRECTVDERRAFYAALERVITDPVAMIDESEAVHDPDASRYMLRFFRFAGYIAIFQTNRERDGIRVIQCRRPYELRGGPIAASQPP